MPRDAVDTIADLAARIKEGRARPVDIMLLYKAFQDMPAGDALRLIEETTGGEFAIVPVEPPEEWNPVKKRGYRLLVREAIARLAAAANDPGPEQAGG